MQVSRYQDLWVTLKEKKTISISVKSDKHKRLKKAIIKRKDLDISFKYLTSENNQKAVLEFLSEGHILKVFLHVRVRSDWI